MLLRAPMLERVDRVVHGFTTRKGGVSTGPFASLNLALKEGDERENVVENWRRVASALSEGWDASATALLHQVHRADVVHVHEPSGPLAVLGQADAMVTATPGVMLAVRTADCVPVLLAAKGAVGAVHSGWRGTALGVVPAAVQALCALAGVGPESVVAAIGPHIAVESYEVGAEVVEGIEASGVSREVFVDDTGARPHVDLGAAIAAQLAAAGVTDVDHVRRDTFTDDALFSHRRSGPVTGRQAGVIGLVG